MQAILSLADDDEIEVDSACNRSPMMSSNQYHKYSKTIGVVAQIIASKYSIVNSIGGSRITPIEPAVITLLLLGIGVWSWLEPCGVRSTHRAL